MWLNSETVTQGEYTWDKEDGSFSEESELLLGSLFDNDCYTQRLDCAIYDYTSEFKAYNYWMVTDIVLFMCEQNLVGKPLDEIVTLKKLINEK